MIYSALAFFLLLAVVAVSACDFPDYSSYTFEQFESEFGKSYASNVERNHAKANFFVNINHVIAHNSKPGQSYSLGVNKYSDLSNHELMSRYTGYNKNMARGMFRGAKVDRFEATGKDIPTSFDWRTQSGGKVTPVKDQGGCGSCWAFSATESIESAMQIQLSDTTILSPQDTTFCTPNPQHCGGTGGCGGATPELAFEWAKTGIATDKDLPYTGISGTKCNTTVKPYAMVDSYVKLPENNDTALLEALVTYGPISVSVSANTWGAYRSGIFTGCGTDWDINHAVQLVGYGEENGTQYWTVRNSWGTSWGEKGYIRLYRGAKETCGTDTTPGDGSGCDGGPASVQVCGSCGIWYDNSVPTKVMKM